MSGRIFGRALRCEECALNNVTKAHSRTFASTPRYQKHGMSSMD